ncbi:Mpt5 protein [Martiniozyma asiatica (nom. inval.)]|nr:Mpt5 protein [Martiniozyma asiatica]
MPPQSTYSSSTPVDSKEPLLIAVNEPLPCTPKISDYSNGDVNFSGFRNSIFDSLNNNVQFSSGMDSATPGSMYSLESVNHNRTSSLPISLKFTNFPSSATSSSNLSIGQLQGLSFNNKRSQSFSQPTSLGTPFLSTLLEQPFTPFDGCTLSASAKMDDLERQLNGFSIDLTPISSTTRRNTLFSNASVSSAGTTKSTGATPSSSCGLSNNLINLCDYRQEEIFALSKDQNGCRLLQKKLDEDVNTNYSVIFNAVYSYSSELMIDPFGNYLIQKIMSLASKQEISLILLEITNIKLISINPHGTRAIQRLIDCLSTSEHHQLFSFLISTYIVDLVHDLNGNHVIQKVISHFNGIELDFLVDLVLINLIPIATHKHGCCVLQKLMNKCAHQQVLLIGKEILKNSHYLMQDQFGNYVIQYLLSLEIPSINNNLLHSVSIDIIRLSCGKFSSNVVEKCLKFRPSRLNNQDYLNPILLSLISITVLNSLIRDQYGNYVIQTALDVSDWNYKCVLAELLRPGLQGIRYTNYGKRIYNKVVGILNDVDFSSSQI